MKHIIKVDNIQEAIDNPIRPLIAADNEGNLFAEGQAAEPTIEMVDFGLPSGTLWAKYNVGVNPSQLTSKYDWYGNYYAWGEVEPKTYYDWTDPNDATQNYKYANGTRDKLTKYCSGSSYGNDGFKDGLTQLVPEDDVATVTNSAWRMPTKEDFEELLAGTTRNWVENYNNVEGLNGIVFMKTILIHAFKNTTLYITGIEITDELWTDILENTEEFNEYLGGDIREMMFKDAEMTIPAVYGTDFSFEEKGVDPSISIFIPAAGGRHKSNINSAEFGGLWSSSIKLDFPYIAWSIRFDSGNTDNLLQSFDRYYGLTIRAVQVAS